MSESKSPAFSEVEKIRDENGIVITITERIKDGMISFRIEKAFEENGLERKTMFLNVRHVRPLIAMLEAQLSRLAAHEDRARERMRQERARQ